MLYYFFYKTHVPNLSLIPRSFTSEQHPIFRHFLASCNLWPLSRFSVKISVSSKLLEALSSHRFHPGDLPEANPRITTAISQQNRIKSPKIIYKEEEAENTTFRAITHLTAAGLTPTSAGSIYQDGLANYSLAG